VFEDRPDQEEIFFFWKEWHALQMSRSGERGIFNRAATRRQAAKTGRRRIDGEDFGTNPCCEIILRKRQLCNLSEVVIREYDTMESLI
jgi:ribonucleoside-diphosphate reductase alpha chain